MFQLRKTIVSEDILQEEFVCNLNACKGACCVQGEAGAPLEKEEVEILKNIHHKISSFLSPEGNRSIEKQGTSITTAEGELETPLIKGKECAYTIFENGTAKCGIEEAYNNGVIEFRKPISCHLYPVRVKDYSEFSAVNYHRWPICEAACSLGKELSVPVYKFVKDALVRKFGEEWYLELEEIAQNLDKK